MNLVFRINQIIIIFAIQIDNVYIQLMKLDYQIQNFLASQSFKSEADWEMISIFSKRHGCSLRMKPQYSDCGLDIATFTAWFNDGFACGEVAKMSGEVVMLGDCTLKNAKIAAKEAAGGVEIVNMTTCITSLEKVSQIVSNEFFEKLAGSYLYFDRDKQVVKRKYVPAINERVVFSNNDMKGLGVIRSFDVESDYVELYCYYIYGTKQVGYSMHEKGICNVRDFDFRPMDITEQRRLKRELEKHGKTWYDRLHRIEPLQVRVDKGSPYWYINDKMKVVQSVDSRSMVSQFRYIAGNYFSSHEEAVEYSGRLSEILRDRLAGS